MKSLFYIMFLVFIVLSFACAASPKVLPNEGLHDFGSVPAGSVLEHEFTFRNAGEQILTIKKVTAT